jgi:L-threonylcarbamoyladenylate synthase
MRTIAVDPHDPAPAAVADAQRVLAAGGLVAFPTETFYGLGADPWNERAIEALYRAKGRPEHLPILLLLAGEDQATAAAAEPPPAFAVLARRFWPGPLTLVVAARASLPARVTSGTGTIGLRVPPAAVPRAIARALGRPITGTSANLSGTPPARLAAEVAAAFPEPASALDLLIDGGPTPGGAPSTVVDLTSAAPRLVRAGAIAFEAVRAALGAGV